MLEDIVKILRELDFNFRLSLSSNKTYRITMGRKESYYFLNWLYEDKNIITMDRKYMLYQELKKYEEYSNSYLTIHKISNLLGIHNQTLYNWRKVFPLKPDKISKNNYHLFFKQTLIDWLNKQGKTNLAVLLYDRLL